MQHTNVWSCMNDTNDKVHSSRVIGGRPTIMRQETIPPPRVKLKKTQKTIFGISPAWNGDSDEDGMGR